jgi:hypothetical protein
VSDLDRIVGDLVLEVRALRAELAGRGAALPRAADTAGLLRVIVAAVGDRVFTCAELVAHSTLPASADLHAAIVASVGAANPRKLGKLLRSIEGQDFAGLSVRRVGSERDGLIWCVASLRV